MAVSTKQPLRWQLLRERTCSSPDRRSSALEWECAPPCSDYAAFLERRSMTADNAATCEIVGGHRPPLQWESRFIFRRRRTYATWNGRARQDGRQHGATPDSERAQ